MAVQETELDDIRHLKTDTDTNYRVYKKYQKLQGKSRVIAEKIAILKEKAQSLEEDIGSEGLIAGMMRESRIRDLQNVHHQLKELELKQKLLNERYNDTRRDAVKAGLKGAGHSFLRSQYNDCMKIRGKLSQEIEQQAIQLNNLKMADGFLDRNKGIEALKREIEKAKNAHDDGRKDNLEKRLVKKQEQARLLERRLSENRTDYAIIQKMMKSVTPSLTIKGKIKSAIKFREAKRAFNKMSDTKNKVRRMLEKTEKEARTKFGPEILDKDVLAERIKANQKALSDNPSSQAIKAELALLNRLQDQTQEFAALSTLSTELEKNKTITPDKVIAAGKNMAMLKGSFDLRDKAREDLNQSQKQYDKVRANPKSKEHLERQVLNRLHAERQYQAINGMIAKAKIPEDLQKLQSNIKELNSLQNRRNKAAQAVEKVYAKVDKVKERFLAIRANLDEYIAKGYHKEAGGPNKERYEAEVRNLDNQGQSLLKANRELRDKTNKLNNISQELSKKTEEFTSPPKLQTLDEMRHQAQNEVVAALPRTSAPDPGSVVGSAAPDMTLAAASPPAAAVAPAIAAPPSAAISPAIAASPAPLVSAVPLEERPDVAPPFIEAMAAPRPEPSLRSEIPKVEEPQVEMTRLEEARRALEVERMRLEELRRGLYAEGQEFEEQRRLDEERRLDDERRLEEERKRLDEERNTLSEERSKFYAERIASTKEELRKLEEGEKRREEANREGEMLEREEAELRQEEHRSLEGGNPVAAAALRPEPHSEAQRDLQAQQPQLQEQQQQVLREPGRQPEAERSGAAPRPKPGSEQGGDKEEEQEEEALAATIAEEGREEEQEEKSQAEERTLEQTKQAELEQQQKPESQPESVQQPLKAESVEAGAEKRESAISPAVPGASSEKQEAVEQEGEPDKMKEQPKQEGEEEQDKDKRGKADSGWRDFGADLIGKKGVEAPESGAKEEQEEARVEAGSIMQAANRLEQENKGRQEGLAQSKPAPGQGHNDEEEREAKAREEEDRQLREQKEREEENQADKESQNSGPKPSNEGAGVASIVTGKLPGGGNYVKITGGRGAVVEDGVIKQKPSPASVSADRRAEQRGIDQNQSNNFADRFHAMSKSSGDFRKSGSDVVGKANVVIESDARGRQTVTFFSRNGKQINNPQQKLSDIARPAPQQEQQSQSKQVGEQEKPKLGRP